MLWHIQIEPAPGHRGSDRRPAWLSRPSSRARRPLVDSRQSRFLDRRRDFRGPSSIGRLARHSSIRSSRFTRFVPASASWEGPGTVVHVMPKPGVTDPEAESALALLRSLDYAVSNVRTIRTYRIDGPARALPRLISRVLANDAVELAVVGAPPVRSARPGAALSIPADRGSPPRRWPTRNSWT